MKSSRMKKILAVILCLTLGLSTNMMTMAESTNSPAVQTVQEEQQTDASVTTDGVEVLAETEQTVTETPTPTATPEPTPTPEVTATPTPEATPEATTTPTPETTPEATATPTPEATPTEVPETQEPTPTPEVTVTPTPEATVASEAEEGDSDTANVLVNEEAQAQEGENRATVHDLTGNPADIDALIENTDRWINSDTSTFEVNNEQYMNVPISDWKTSRKEQDKLWGKVPTGYVNVEKNNWTWSDVNKKLVADNSDVWDGSRSATHYSDIHTGADRYLQPNVITAYTEENGVQTLYDSMTWSTGDNRDNDETSMYRLQGHFILDTEDITSSSFTLNQVTLDGNLYINDDMYVMIYPTVLEEQITDQNFTEFMAFWSGTLAQDQNRVAFPQDYWNNDLVYWSNRAYHTFEWYEGTNKQRALAELTDVWHMKAADDNAGDAIIRGYEKLSNQQKQADTIQYTIDVFFDDYAASGGMYRLVLGEQKQQKVPFTFYKTDVNGSALEGAEFYLVSTEDSNRHYTETSGADGKVEFESLLPGEYILTETQAPDNYKENTGEWKVQIGIDSSGNPIINFTDTNSKTAKNDYLVDNVTYWRIINESDQVNITLYKKDQSDNPISGVEFTITGSNGYSGTVTSGENGIITLEGLQKGGTYTLTETQTPSGYFSAGPWTITVKEDGTYTLSGDNHKDNNIIINQSISEALQLSKSAEQHGETEERMFKITLNADSLKQTTGEDSAQPIDVVLVLDVSNSMNYWGGSLSGTVVNSEGLEISYGGHNRHYYYYVDDSTLYRVYGEWSYGRSVWYRQEYYISSGTSYNHGFRNRQQFNKDTVNEYYTNYSTRLEGMKTAAKSFLELLADKSSESNVGIVTFAGSVQDTTVAYGNPSGLLNVGTQINSLTQFIDGIDNTASSTTPSTGLSRAATMLQSSTNGKYVVLLSDGAPTEGKNAGITQAATMIRNGITLSTVGFMTDEDTNGYLIKVAEGSADAVSSDNAYAASNIEELINSFDLILEGITESAPITKGRIYDEIDSRFVVVDENGEKMNDGDPITSDDEVIGTLHIEENRTYIEWTNQTIDPYDETNQKHGWSVSFYLKAKEDFIGGNMIPTNGAAYVEVGNVKKDFNKPTVNVALLELSMNDITKTIFLGDTISPQATPAFANQLLENLKFANGQEIPNLNLENVTFNLVDGTLQVELDNYSYGSDAQNDPIGKFKFTFSPVSGKGDLNEHIAEQVGDGVEEYCLTVEYTAYSKTERTNQLGNGFDQPSNSELTGDDAITGVDSSYIINVIAGSINITKTINDINPDLEGDAIFTFKIEKLNGGNVEETYYRTIRMNESGSANAEVLTGLAKGTYRVTEMSTQKYSLQSIALTDRGIAGENLTGDLDNKCIEFTIGNQEITDDKTCLDQTAHVTFSNNKTGPSTNTDTDVRLNRFVYENGEWVIESYQTPQNVDENPEDSTRKSAQQ